MLHQSVFRNPGIKRYLVFFLLIAFLTACCISLFSVTLAKSLHVQLSQENLSLAAKLTFGNVVILSLLFTAIDFIRRELVIQRSVRHIVQAAQTIVAGDFSVRVKPISRFSSDESFNEIVQCFNHMAEELASVETLRTDFIANVSHELKTPLAAMNNYATLLQAPNLPEEQRVVYAKAIAQRSRQLSRMMTNILKLNKLENQQIYPNCRPYDLSDQLCQSLLQFEDVWESKDIDLDTQIPDRVTISADQELLELVWNNLLWESKDIDLDTQIPDRVTISADQELLELVWNNLLSNAFKFTPAGGQVRLCLRQLDQQVAVTIQDTGCGMSPNTQSHIFEKFYQGDTSHATQGNGLGLALVRRVVDICQGSIQLTSAPGQGTTFTITLPTAPPRA